MKKNTAILISLILIVSLSATAFAAETRKGTIKGVDVNTGTITFCPEGTTGDMTLKVDKSVDLSKVKPETKAEVVLDKDTVKGIKEMKKPKVPVGC
jgi:Cu/Ag efflux protein CusF